MTRLNLLPLSEHGRSVMDFLLANERLLLCHCRPDESCLVEIIELSGQRFDAVVTLPRPLVEPGEWKAYAVVPGMYARRFDSTTSKEEILEAVAMMLATPMRNKKTPSLSSGLHMVVVDSGLLRKAETMVVGCEGCSSSAQIPFDCVLDRVSGNDPLVTQYLIPKGMARCPRCRRSMSEETLVVFEPRLDVAY